MKQELTHSLLQKEAKSFAEKESLHFEDSLFGVTDGKRIGTYLEHKFKKFLEERFEFLKGNSAKGIDFPGILVDMKVTSFAQPQSSCPYKSAKQKIYGLGYALLIFVYEKRDDQKTKQGLLNIKHTVFVSSENTADYQTTKGVLKILDNGANKDDLLGFFEERMLPVDEIEAERMANEILKNRPNIGYLTISNALQWRLQYARVIQQAGKIDGIIRVL